MSLADRYPRLRDRELPEWVAKSTDDDADPIEAARRSQHEQAERLMRTELTLFDTTPDLTDIESSPAVVYDKPNRRHGHLLIAAKGADYVFINDGGGVIRFGHFAGPAVELTPDQLRTVGDYCHRMADRIEGLK